MTVADAGPWEPSTAAEAALSQRLAVVRATLGASGTTHAVPEDGLAELLATITAVTEAGDLASAWLLLVGLTGAMPDQDAVRAVARSLRTKGAEDAAVWLLDAATPLAIRDGQADATIRVVSDRPLVDVHLTARSDFLTGIQRVVRGVAAEWTEHHPVELVAWSARDGAYRALDEMELARLRTAEVGTFDAEARVARTSQTELVVPWGVPLVLTEVPSEVHSDRLAAIAALTHTSVRLIGYDCIPVSSAELVPLAEPEKFGRYLELVKHADRLAGISRAAAAEFEGFCRALSAQGLRGPAVVACPLPETVPIFGVTAAEEPSGRPVVASVGTVGRRKNQTALVEAAEVLWREGLDFELRILGHVAAERTPLVDLVPELQELGRPLVVESGVSDARIAATFAESRCLAFPTLHEGFGLPVVEALSHGVPVVTSDFGSVREVAEGKGGLLVDPEDVDALADALRALLTDDDLHARLVSEALARPVRSWREYAADLYEALLA